MQRGQEGLGSHAPLPACPLNRLPVAPPHPQHTLALLLFSSLQQVAKLLYDVLGLAPPPGMVPTRGLARATSRSTNVGLLGLTQGYMVGM